ncbi:MAG TPA: hypothetical protein VFA99_19080, partial [Acidobacteriaceae bacterium]|nr:hypothetical protein [Acidobacteriaceae bacterium]
VDLFTDMYVNLSDHSGTRSVRLEVDDGLNFAVGRDRAGKVLPADSRGTHLDDRLAVHEEKNSDHDNNGEQNPKPRT